MRYIKGDRVIIVQYTPYIEKGIILKPGNTGKIVREEFKSNGTVLIEMDSGDYHPNSLLNTQPIFSMSFSLIISKSRIELDIKRNRENKIDNLFYA